MLSHGSCNLRGVAILLKRGVDFSIQSKILDPLGRFIILKAEIADTIYVLINIYAPNKDKEIDKVFKDLKNLLKKENLDTKENIIVYEGLNRVNRLATKGDKYYRLPTKREKNYRLPTEKILTDHRHGRT